MTGLPSPARRARERARTSGSTPAREGAFLPVSSSGFGAFGQLEITETGEMTRHECGRSFRHLGLHVWRAHGELADEYRRKHGLARGRGLVAADLQATIRRNAKSRMDSFAGAAFVAARDPVRARAAYVASGAPWAPQVRTEHAQRMAARNRARRLGRVVVCGCCGAAFCPLVGAARRKFCSRSCASKANRRARREAQTTDVRTEKA
jgi:hypothetical protein